MIDLPATRPTRDLELAFIFHAVTRDNRDVISQLGQRNPLLLSGLHTRFMVALQGLHIFTGEGCLLG